MISTLTPEQLMRLDEKFSLLKDNRSFEQYMFDVIENGKKQKSLCDGFIVTLAINDIETKSLRDTSCENSSDMDFHFDVDMVTAEPDYEVDIMGVVTSLEFKGTNKEITHLMIKKYDIDKYALKKSCLIVHVINSDGTHPSFTLLTPQEVQQWQVAVDENYFGRKEIYIDACSNHKYFTMKILDNDLKNYIRNKLGVVINVEELEER
jgi:hypothetical protein